MTDSPTVPPDSMEVPQTKRPTLVKGNRKHKVHPKEILTSVMAQGEDSANRNKYRYQFLRVTRYPTFDRPDSGRICVKNEETGKVSEFYAIWFNLNWLW